MKRPTKSEIETMAKRLHKELTPVMRREPQFRAFSFPKEWDRVVSFNQLCYRIFAKWHLLNK
jgi:hypothetical protein